MYMYIDTYVYVYIYIKTYVDRHFLASISTRHRRVHLDAVAMPQPAPPITIHRLIYMYVSRSACKKKTPETVCGSLGACLPVNVG